MLVTDRNILLQIETLEIKKCLIYQKQHYEINSLQLQLLDTWISSMWLSISGKYQKRYVSTLRD